jgi:AcrR family transcriptional regulator
VPTGVAIRDAREQLFAAAERVLLRDGPQALTSRAVTAEAGVAKGVLHRHFADFDAFLVELVQDRIAGIDQQGAALLAAAGTGSVTGNLTAALTELFGSVAAVMVLLLIFRDDLRAALRQAGLRGVPIAAEAAEMIRSYLVREQELGRIAAEADVPALGLMLIGSAHMMYADRGDAPPDTADVENFVAAVISGAAQEPASPGPRTGTRYEGG